MISLTQIKQCISFYSSHLNLFIFDTKEVKQTLGDYLTSLTEVTPLSSAAKAKQRVGGGCSILVHLSAQKLASRSKDVLDRAGPVECLNQGDHIG